MEVREKKKKGKRRKTRRRNRKRARSSMDAKGGGREKGANRKKVRDPSMTNEGGKGKEEGKDEEATKRKGEEKDEKRESPKSSVRLTTRDKELLAHVAAARYLTLSQLKRIVFVRPLVANGGARASGKGGPSEDVCRRRLMKLCGGNAAYLRRLHYRDHEGTAVSVYASELLGHSIARQVLRSDSGQRRMND